MAEKQQTEATAEAPAYSEADQNKARQWFRKAEDCRERREYDYAIECFISGLGFWPEAVEEGHMPLRALAMQRQQAGGKKPGMMEGLKKSMIGKDAKQCMLNAEHLWAKDLSSSSYLDGLLKNANRAGFNETVKWVAPLVLDSLRRDKKPNTGRFKVFRQAMVDSAERLDAQGDLPLAAWFYEQAVNAMDYLVMRNPGDMALRDEQRDLSGKLTITKGKYAEADTFRDSLQDAEKQKLIHDAERVKQADQTLDALIAAARKDLAEHPGVPAKINALADALLKPERKKEEDEAIELLIKAYEESHNYSFRERADTVRLRQLERQTRQLGARAAQSGSEEDRQQHRLAEMDQLETELEVFRERCARYPTDLRRKYRLGKALFRTGRYDEAIPVLQQAQGDPHNRVACQVFIGRSFAEQGDHRQAAEVLKDALEHYENPGDDVSKELMYRLGVAYEADGRKEQAVDMLGKLLRIDYNYAKGDARRRLEKLK
jgi:tetratricopeptide (TPR) repeat protein